MPIHDSISPFGGFAPFPNSIMIPFMGAQSAVLGYDFGLSYEAGKRMIKSMDNEDFNKFIKDGNTVDFEGVQQNLLSVFSKKHYRIMMQQFTDNIPKAMDVMDTIIEKSVEIEMKKAERTPSATAEIVTSFYTGVFKAGKNTGLDFKAILLQLFGPIFGIGGNDQTENEEIPIIPKTSPTPTVDSPTVTLPDDFDENLPKEPTTKDPPQSATFNIQYPYTLKETHTATEWSKIISYWYDLAIKYPQTWQYKAMFNSLNKAFNYFFFTQYSYTKSTVVIG